MTTPATPAAPILGHVEGVELIDTGTWRAASGPFTPTAEDIAAAISALDCPSVRRPVLKAGHDGQHGVGEPALGYVANLRSSNEGQTLVGDFRGMPGWLTSVDEHGTSILSAAFPDRSVEAEYGFVCQLGHEHPFVVHAVSLLGVELPAIGTLQSLQEIYGVAAAQEHSVGGRPVRFNLAAQEAPMPQQVTAGLTTDDVRRAFYATPAGQPWDVWIREMYVDPPELIVDHDNDSSIWRIPYTAADEDVTFGESQQVRVEYVTARASVTAPAVTFAGRDEARHVPALPTASAPEPSTAPAAEPAAGGGTTPEEEGIMPDTLTSGLRERLGFAEDADEATILAAVDEALTERADTTATPSLPEGTVVLDAQQHADLIAAAQAGREAREQQLREARERTVDAAIGDGRIPPARRDHWLGLLQADPGAETVLAGLAKGTVPLAELGSDNGESSADDAVYASLFPAEKKG